jgi:hypothetical protein
MVGLIIFIIAVSASLAWLWAGGINYIIRKHPKHKGENFFNEEDKNEVL